MQERNANAPHMALHRNTAFVETACHSCRLFHVAWIFAQGLCFVLCCMYREWRDHRRDDEIVVYLIAAVESCPLVTDSYGQPSTAYYRNSLQIADAVSRESVDVRHRLHKSA
jgi:hypothetical protein